MSVEAVALAVNRQVTSAELREALEGVIEADERDEVLSLVRWFTGRYARPEERLAYVRAAYDRWRRTPGGQAAPAVTSQAGDA